LEALIIDQRWFIGLLTAIAVALVTAGMAQLQDVPGARNVALVHGLYADGSSWIDVIGYLQRAGLKVTAVQNPLTSLADDVAATRRALALQDGPTVLVGHSFAGTIISEAGNDPKDSALVYVVTRAPDAGEDFAALAAKYPKPRASVGVVRKDGFFWRSEAALRDFVGDVEPSKARALYAVQGLTGCKHKDLDCGMGSEANVVPSIDRRSHHQFEARAISGQAHSTIELDSSHVSLVSHPQESADPNLLAAGQKKSQ
jgi:pimeloyl-ACP methyl ester carboxylesterase